LSATTTKKVLQHFEQMSLFGRKQLEERESERDSVSDEAHVQQNSFLQNLSLSDSAERSKKLRPKREKIGDEENAELTAAALQVSDE
jgi:hypothetical protein